eukprot:gene19014-22760_t
MFKEGKYESAIEKYTMAVDAIGDAEESRVSTLINVLFKRAGIYQTRNRNNLALVDLNRALQYNPDNVHAKIKRAKILTSLGRFEDATEEYRLILKQKPDNAVAKAALATISQSNDLLKQARQLVADKKYTEAMPVLNKILEATSDIKEAKLLRAETAYHTADFRRTLDDTMSVLKSEASNLDALYWRGRAFFSIGEKEAALKFLKEALKFDPDHVKSKEQFKSINKFEKSSTNANELFTQNNFEEALKARKGEDSVKACTKAIEIEESADAFYNRGEAHMYNDDYDRALHDFNKARHP